MQSKSKLIIHLIPVKIAMIKKENNRYNRKDMNKEGQFYITNMNINYSSNYLSHIEITQDS